MMGLRTLAELTPSEVQAMASEAAAKAVADSVVRGLPVTGLQDGLVVTLPADDVRLVCAAERANSAGICK